MHSDKTKLRRFALQLCFPGDAKRYPHMVEIVQKIGLVTISTEAGINGSLADDIEKILSKCAFRSARLNSAVQVSVSAFGTRQ